MLVVFYFVYQLFSWMYFIVRCCKLGFYAKYYNLLSHLFGISLVENKLAEYITPCKKLR